MFGIYENFPKTVHGIAYFTCQISPSKMQQIILALIHGLNQKTLDLSKITLTQPEKYVVGFEFGIAEGNDFTFFDEEELKRSFKAIAKQKLPILDFFCVARYHIVNDNGKHQPLKFDYYMLRFFFKEKNMELFLVHQRGTLRISIEDLAIFLSNEINEELLKEGLKPIKLNSFVKFPLAP
jgi:hypothetical protein